MTAAREWEFAGTRGAITARIWADGEPRYIAVLAHGYVEAIRGGDLAQRIYPGARHEVFNETNRDEVLGDVTAFVDRVLG
ncbi:hypothetical protein F8568_008570 [Actinomadura sp. LD22]|uniref:Lysophospholipase n=1 Tax=Actinomadura physcomitrii TaxID=2650748 RepID=A0A6I4M8J6_9ACTN|nr:hypothetical protein [Actinomadura physcomitrii]